MKDNILVAVSKAREALRDAEQARVSRKGVEKIIEMIERPLQSLKEQHSELLERESDALADAVDAVFGFESHELDAALEKLAAAVLKLEGEPSLPSSPE